MGSSTFYGSRYLPDPLPAASSDNLTSWRFKFIAREDLVQGKYLSAKQLGFNCKISLEDIRWVRRTKATYQKSRFN
jgi:hypothetical protein